MHHNLISSPSQHSIRGSFPRAHNLTLRQLNITTDSVYHMYFYIVTHKFFISRFPIMSPRPNSDTHAHTPTNTRTLFPYLYLNLSMATDRCVGNCLWQVQVLWSFSGSRSTSCRKMQLQSSSLRASRTPTFSSLARLKVPFPH